MDSFLVDLLATKYSWLETGLILNEQSDHVYWRYDNQLCLCPFHPNNS